MASKIDSLLNRALSLSPSERALIAHCLISSIDETADENVDKSWFELADKRISELEKQKVKPVVWQELKQKLRDS